MQMTLPLWQKVKKKLKSLLMKVKEGSEKAGKFQKNIYFSFIDCAEAFDCVDHNKLWKILKEMVIQGNLPPEKSV